MEKFITPDPDEDRDRAYVRHVLSILHEIDPGAQGSFETYITVNVTDSEYGWAEIRLLKSPDDDSFILNANIGNPLALLGLKRFLVSKGIPISYLKALRTTPEERRILDAECAS